MKNESKLLAIYSLAAFIRVAVGAGIMVWAFESWTIERAVIVSLFVDHVLERGSQHVTNVRTAELHKTHNDIMETITTNLGVVIEILKKYVP